MIMITDPETGRVAVIDRIRSWCGFAFPGGHVEKGESFADSAVREVREETGLCINSLESCGIIQWIHTDTGARYIVLCYRTNDFTGTLKTESDEGKISWMTLSELRAAPSENDFLKYLPLFTGNYNEAVGLYNDDGNIDFRYI